MIGREGAARSVNYCTASLPRYDQERGGRDCTVAHHSLPFPAIRLVRSSCFLHRQRCEKRVADEVGRGRWQGPRYKCPLRSMFMECLEALRASRLSSRWKQRPPQELSGHHTAQRYSSISEEVCRVRKGKREAMAVTMCG